MPPTDRNILIGLAKIGERQEALAKQMEERDDRQVERYEALVARLDERHQSLLSKLEDQEEAFLERLEAAKSRVLESIRPEFAEMLQPLAAKVAQLEQAKTKLVAWGTGGGVLATVVAWLAENFLRLLPVAVVLGVGAGWLLTGCTDDRQWSRPIPIYIDPGLPQNCKNAVDGALGFWQARGVDYLKPAVEPKKPARGVYVTKYDLPPDTLGRIVQPDLGVELAWIQLDECDGVLGTQVAAHELAHLMGLDHVNDNKNLMYELSFGANWDLEDWQLSIVR